MRGWILSGLCACLCTALIGAAAGQDSSALRARHSTLIEKLKNSQFQRPLYLESTQTSDQLRGEIYATLAQPYSSVQEALQDMDHWCDILILHLNVKNCQVTGTPARQVTMFLGRKYDEPLQRAYRVDFAYRIVAASSEYQQIVLDAATGPLGTKNYRIMVESVSLDERTTFMHLSYSYTFGVTARIAMGGYLATLGRNKVGFSLAGRNADGSPIYIDGVRGAVERNAMRYYLAIQAYLDSLSVPEPQQTEKRLRDWYAATERYSLQLHELERNEYLEMKGLELARQAGEVAH